MRRVILVTVAVAGTLTVVACGDECGSYSHYSCEQIKRADYNVFFYYRSHDYPPQQDRHLGQASGLNQCQSMARNYPIDQEIAEADWGYICCMIAHGSDCYEKHK
jgi:hypothetical protein